MGYRYMRVIVLFDLPVESASDRSEYSKFRRFLIKSGFLMMQESIYCKLAVNSTMADSIGTSVKRNKPPRGLVQILKITEKQYANIEFVVGESVSEVVDTDEPLVIL